MELIVHDNVKFAMQNVMLVPDELGCKVTFFFEHLVLSNYIACLFAGIDPQILNPVMPVWIEVCTTLPKIHMQL